MPHETSATPEHAAVTFFPPTFASVESVTYSRGGKRAKVALLTNEGPCFACCKRDESGRWIEIRMKRRRDTDWQPEIHERCFRNSGEWPSGCGSMGRGRRPWHQGSFRNSGPGQFPFTAKGRAEACLRPFVAVRRQLLLAGFRLDLRDHQDIPVRIGELHLLRRARGSVLDLAGVDPIGEQLLAQPGQVA